MSNITALFKTTLWLSSFVLALLIAPAPSRANEGPPEPPDPGHLLVADTLAEAVYAYRLPGLALTGRLDGVVVATHAGTLALPDGRVLFADEKAGELVALQLDAQGVPRIVQRAPVNLADGAAWATSDRALEHFVVSVDIADSQTKAVHVVDLKTFASTSLEVGPATEEVHPFIAADWLVLGLGGEARGFLLDDVLAGKAPEARAILPVGAGSHGPVIAHDLKRGYISTEAGLEGFDYRAGQLAPLDAVIPWDAGRGATGQNFRPRLSWDGVYVYGAITATTPEDPARWAEREVDVHAADLLNESATRVHLGHGIVSRFQLSRSHALFANVSGDGDFAYLFDVGRGSPAFHEVVAKIPLEPLSNGPVTGEDPAEREARSAAITPDGRYAFVSHGGDGLISVIDTARRRVVRKLETPTPLENGGYLLAIQRGVVPTDTSAR